MGKSVPNESTGQNSEDSPPRLMTMKKTKIVIIVGPTAIGKSQSALELATKLGAEIINADSMQIYRHMDIGTAKPTLDEQKRVRHHLIDILSPDEEFNAALFKERARETILRLHKEKKTAIVVGGTGLYIKALTQGLFECPKADEKFRETQKKKAFLSGNVGLHEELKSIDPITAARLHPNDSFRIVRALEVYHTTKKSLSEHHKDHGFKDSPFDSLKIGLFQERQLLYSRIEKRVDRMIGTGLIEEVKSLLDMGYKRELTAMQGLGYKQLIGYLLKECSLDAAISQIKRGTRKLAKRQTTWFRSDPQINWYPYPNSHQNILHTIKEFLTGRSAGPQ